MPSPRPSPPQESPQSWEESDERYWKGQEKRFLGQIAQPCCSLSGMATLLASMSGDFAVVLHGEADCANSFVSVQGRSSTQFYCTRISQGEFTSGRTAGPLRRCLELLIRVKKPKVVIVLGNCLLEMIHDDYERVAQEVQERTGARVVALRTHGLKAGSQAETVDRLYSTLASLARPPEGRGDARRDRLANFIALPRLRREARREFDSYLSASRVAVNGRYPFDTSLDDWMRILDAGASFVVDRSLFPRLISILEGAGMPCIEVPLPVGLAQTERFLAAIASQFGADMESAAARARERARERLGRFRGRFAGLRVAVGLRMVNNYQADQIAYDGLGDLAFLAEIGFEATLFIQGPPEDSARRRFAERLESLGCRLPFHIFPDPIDLPPLLRAGRFDAAYLAAHATGEALKAGVPLIKGRSLEPFFEGAVHNMDMLEEALDAIRAEGGGSP